MLNVPSVIYIPSGYKRSRVMENLAAICDKRQTGILEVLC